MAARGRAEQAEAQIALRGLEGVDSALPAAANAYDGPRDPEALLAHLGHREFRPGQLETV